MAVIGAGHNGLIAACLLSRAGLNVVVLERDTIPGGAVSTIERFPGYRVDRGSSAHIMIRHTGVIDDLDLHRHGLSYIDCDPWAFAPATDTAPAIVFSTDLDATCASIESACGAADADAYRAFVGVWAPRASSVLRMFSHPPRPWTFARSFWGLPTRDGIRGPSAGAGLAQEFLQSGDALVDSWFSSERLKAALTWFGAQSGPPMSEPGTASMVGVAAIMHQLPPGRAIGGSGALTDALLSALAETGGQLRTNSAVVALSHRPGRSRHDGHWQLRTVHDEVLTADTVVGASHIFTTLDALAAGGHLTDEIARWRCRINVGNGIGSAIRIGATELPHYRGVPDLAHSGLGLLVSNRGQLARAYGEARAGYLPSRPAVLAMGFSAIDPTIAPPGRHQVTLWTQWHPRYFADGSSWDAMRNQAIDQALAECDSYAPGFSSTIEHIYAQTPDRLESELALPAGNVMHVEMSTDHMFAFRPHPDLAGYRIPGVPQLFLAGASTHPGGGVSGMSGTTVARLILNQRGTVAQRVQRRITKSTRVYRP